MKRPPPRWRTEAMLLINCPYCGQRPEVEFSYGGEAHIARPTPPESVSAEDWGAFLYLRHNRPRARAQRWRQVRGCARFFNALRDTTTDQFLAIYRCGEPRP